MKFKEYKMLFESFDEFNSLDIKKLAKYIDKNDDFSKSYLMGRFADSKFIKTLKPVVRGEIILDNRELLSPIIRGIGTPITDNYISASAFSRSKTKSIGLVYEYNGKANGIYVPSIYDAIMKLSDDELQHIGFDKNHIAWRKMVEDNETLLMDNIELEPVYINSNTVKNTNKLLERYGYELPSNAKDNKLIPISELIEIVQ